MHYQPDDSLKRSIRAAMDGKTTEELEDIWLEHDSSQWTDEAFDVVRSLLLERTHELPEPDEPEEPETPAVQEPAAPAVTVEDPLDVLTERAVRSVLRLGIVAAIILVLLSGHFSPLAALAVILAAIVVIVLYQLNKRWQTPPGK